MINIGNLLDACGIYYTDKQLSKLEKLVNDLLKKLSLQQFDSATDSKDKSSNEDFVNIKELKPFELDFESRSQYEKYNQGRNTGRKCRRNKRRVSQRSICIFRNNRKCREC